MDLPTDCHRRIGLFGGSFDPIHKGHLAIGRVALGQSRLDRVIFMVARQSPLKGEAGADANARLAMTRLACAGEAAFEVSDREFARRGPSYTIDTINELQQVHRDCEIVLILGSDSLVLFPRWHCAAEILQLAEVIVAPRPGVGKEVFDNADWAPLRARAETFKWLSMPVHPASSTEIREKLRKGQMPSNWLPPRVQTYIRDHHLYDREPGN